ncbi:MAG: glycosyltransferase [Solirubrobacterales bacterium]|nr:glycosyltransferase [Solirubrobacterales bacterium]
MRIALVTPYSWTYEGGVNRHTQALAEHLIGRGNEVRVLSPWDPPDRLSRTLHRGASPRVRPMPDYLTPLGRTVGFGANGAVSNLSVFPDAIASLRRELRDGGFDVVHVQEPPAPTLGWDACGFGGAPVVGTFHAYAPKLIPQQIAIGLGARRKFNQLSARIAVSEAAEWTGKRWYGGSYEIIPNGVDVGLADQQALDGGREELRLLFVGRPEERKGLPVLLRAFEALVEHIPARLVVIGTAPEDIARNLADPETLAEIEALGAVERKRLWSELAAADVLCAPSLSGESFGMVLTEAFAAGTPVIASEIAGYADVVEHGVDGVLIPPGDPQRLAEELLRLHVEPDRRVEMGEAARESAERFAWPRIAARVEQVYERALSVPQPADRLTRIAQRHGFAPADGLPRAPAARIPSPEPMPVDTTPRRRRVARRLGLGIGALAGFALTFLAARRIGFDSVVESAVRSDFAWVAVATALMCTSMFFRAGAWFQTARSALPRTPLRRRDFTSATMIGVLMSATLPARLGEPARAMVIARRIGRFRETFPILLGTLVSQTVFNVLALVLLGAIIVSSTDLFHRTSEHLFLVSLAPAMLLVAVIAAPAAVRRSGSGRLARLATMVRSALVRVRRGLAVFRDPRRAPVAGALQIIAWAIQVAACWALAVAMGLDGAMGLAGAAAVLFAVNVTAVIPATPSNIGVFQLAVISVLTTGYGVDAADALAYGVILQAVEIATAVGLGVPALVREGMSWSDVRLRALSAAPVRLQPVDEADERIRA